jgi:hypothetical protein
VPAAAALAAGLTGSRIPYGYIQEHPETLIVTGLPLGLEFKKPCCYKAHEKAAIIDAKDSIKFIGMLFFHL